MHLASVVQLQASNGWLRLEANFAFQSFLRAQGEKKGKATKRHMYCHHSLTTKPGSEYSGVELLTVALTRPSNRVTTADS